MNEEQEKFIEDFIEETKKHNGMLPTQVFVNKFLPVSPEKNKERNTISNHMIKNLGFFEIIGNHTLRLTPKGHKFKSFDDERAKEKKEQDRLDLDDRYKQAGINAHELNVKNSKKNTTDRRINIIIGIINAIAVIVNIIFSSFLND